MLTQQTKIIEVRDARRGDFHETTLEPTPRAAFDPFPFLEATAFDGKPYRLALREALIQQPDAGNLLRDGIRAIAFAEYMAMPVSYPLFTRVEASSKKEETFLRDGMIGRIPRVRSGEVAPYITRRFDGGVTIENHKYDALAEVLGDDIRFDRLGIIRQTAELMGRSGRITEEAEVYRVITDPAQYTRSKAKGDNDVDANTQNWELTAVNFEKALALIATAKDRQSGAYLGLRADTMIVGPLMEYPALKLLNSATTNVAAGTGSATERGTLNPYQNVIKRVIVSPYLTDSYDWVLADTRVPGLTLLQVEPFNVYQTTMTPDNRAWLERDVIEFKVMGYFGVGFVDDRGWFFSQSATRPTL
jgi:phage major head subunit gpT-like protein